MDQVVVNWLLGALGTICGFLLNMVWQAVKDLQEADKMLSDKVSAIEVLVAGAYVSRDEFLRMLGDLFKKLDHIENKIDRKADK